MTTGDTASHADPGPQAPPSRVGELLENPVTGERGIVRIPPMPANGDRLVADMYLRPGGRVSGEHVHPASTEAFTVVRGQLSVHHGGRELQADPGTRVQVPPGVAHDFWNAGSQEAHVILGTSSPATTSWTACAPRSTTPTAPWRWSPPPTWPRRTAPTSGPARTLVGRARRVQEPGRVHRGTPTTGCAPSGAAAGRPTRTGRGARTRPPARPCP
jgi:mannose-6-phosphate isomerase-like protein (cupin superfamily)